MRTISVSPRISPPVSCLIISMNLSIDWVTPGRLSRSHWLSKRGRNGPELLLRDVDDPGHVAHALVVEGAVDGGDELVVVVLGVLVVLAVLVADVCLAVQERDHQRVLETHLEEIGLGAAEGGGDVVAQKGATARAIDHDVVRSDHRQSVLGGQFAHDALDGAGAACVDQVAERLLDGVERTEAQRPIQQECPQVGRNRLPRRDAFVQVGAVEHRFDVLAVDVVDAVVLDRIGDQVRVELHHPGARV